MPDTVDDLLETLHGPISDQLRQREGVRLSKVKIDKAHVGPKPEDNRAVDAGTPGKRPLNQGDLSEKEQKFVKSGGHIEGLDEE